MAEPTETKRTVVTRADVARHAGVSPALVSYVINDSERPVSAEARARIVDAIRVLGYRPNAVARALRKGTTRTIGLLLPDSGNPLFAEMARAIELEAAEAGYAVILTNARGDDDRQVQQLRNLVDRQIDGLVIVEASSATSRADLIASFGIPCVLLNRASPVSGVRTAGVDFEGGSRMAVEHLLQHGHTSVAAVLGDDGGSSTIARERGWARALRAAGAAEGPTVRVEFSRAGGYEAGRTLLTRDERPSAVFVSSDLQAIGFLKAAHELGVAVPRDIAIVAFDGSLECEYSWPPLSVVRQPLEALAASGIAAVLTPGEPAHTAFAAELVIRASCGCDASGA